MKEIRSIIAKYEALKGTGVKMALATVVNVEHSSYRRSGARMLITEDGNWVGGISGGCLEGDTLKKAMFAIHKNEAVKVTYDTREDDPSQIGVGLGCNGLIDVLIVPISDTKDNPIELLKSIVDCRHSTIILTNLKNGRTDLVSNISRYKELSDQIIQVSYKKKSKNSNDNKFFIEYLPPEINVFVFGKNYDVIPLIEIAQAVGWKVNIVANPQTVSKTIYAQADEIINPKKDKLKIDDYCVALLMSHDFKTDKENLVKLQSYNLRYIGLLGPKKRKEKMISELDAEGIKIAKPRIYGPMGLDTGATTPEEIAISVIAEIRAFFSGRHGGTLRRRIYSIHSD